MNECLKLCLKLCQVFATKYSNKCIAILNSIHTTLLLVHAIQGYFCVLFTFSWRMVLLARGYGWEVTWHDSVSEWKSFLCQRGFPCSSREIYVQKCWQTKRRENLPETLYTTMSKWQKHLNSFWVIGWSFVCWFVMPNLWGWFKITRQQFIIVMGFCVIAHAKHLTPYTNTSKASQHS